MPEPAYPSIGLAMKQAVTPCRRAARDQPLQHDQIVGRLQHVPAVVERQLVLAWRIFGDDGVGRCLAWRRRHRCRQTAAPCRADGRPNTPSVLPLRRPSRTAPAGCTRPSASRSLASRKNSSSKAPAASTPPARDLNCRASAWRGSQGIGWPSRWYIDISIWPRAGLVPCSGTRVPDRPGAQIAVAGIPDQSGLVHVLAGDVEAEIHIGRWRPCSYRAASSWRRMILPRPTPLESVSTMSKASIPGCASRKAPASSRREPDGEFVDVLKAIRSQDDAAACPRSEPLRSIAEGGDEPVDLASSVTGDTSIMSWNGAIRMPRLTSYMWIAASSSAYARPPPRRRRPAGLARRRIRRARRPGRRARARRSGRPSLEALLQPRGEAFPVIVVLRRHHLFQRGAHRRELQRVGRKRGADAGIARRSSSGRRRRSAPPCRRSCPRCWPARRRRSACRARTDRSSPCARV